MSNKYLLIAGVIIPYIAGAKNLTVVDTIPIREVNVIESSRSISLENTSLSVVDVNRTTIDNSNNANVLPVLNKSVSGLFTAAKGIMGYGISTNSAGSINIHGVGQSNKVLTMIDGVPNFAGIFGHSISDTWSSINVETIEVVKGPASVYYGTNAMGGSINVITREQVNNGYTVNGRASIGSWATQDYNLYFGCRKDKFSMGVSGTYNYTDGDRESSKFHLWNTSFTSKYRMNRNWNSIANLYITKFKGYNPGAENKPILDNWMQALRGTANISVNNMYENFYGSVSAYYSWGNHKIDDGYFENQNPRDYYFRSNDHIWGISAVENGKFWKNGLISLGVDYQNWGGKSWNQNKESGAKTWDKFLSEDGEMINNIGTFANIQQQIGGIITLNLGTRYQYSNQFGSKWVPQAGIIISTNDNYDIKLNFSEGFRAPNLRELYMYASANPDLKPEDMYQYDITYKQYLINKRLMLKLCLFYIEGKNIIETQNIDGRQKNVNVGRFYNKGFDIDFNYNINRNFNVMSNYSFLYTNKKLLAAPKHKINLGVSYEYNGFKIGVDNETVLGLYLNTSTASKSSDFSLLNATISYDINSWNVKLTPFVDLNNITNTHYSIMEGFPMPGFNFRAGVKFKL